MSKSLAFSFQLTEHELCFAADLVDPNSISISWSDIGGLDETIRTIREKVIFPFKRRDLLAGSSLIRPPKGTEVLKSFKEEKLKCDDHLPSLI